MQNIITQNSELYNLKKKFLKLFPPEKIKTLTLEEYSNSENNSFIYHMEFGLLKNLGGIRGGSAFKFGIFKHRKEEVENREEKGKKIWEGFYAWQQNYGESKNEAFENIRKNIVKIIENTQSDNLKAIDKIVNRNDNRSLSHHFAWKIAFVYGKENVINIFNQDALKVSMDYFNESYNDNIQT